MVSRKVRNALKAHQGAVTAALFLRNHNNTTPSLTTNAFVSAGNDTQVCAWKLDRTGKVVNTFRSHHHKRVSGLACHPGGSLLISASADETWKLFDLQPGVCLSTVAASDTSPSVYTCLRLHPDGLVLGLGLDSGDLGIWDIREQKCVSLLSAHTASLSSVDFSENGYLAASGDVQGVVKVWDLRKLKCMQSFSLDRMQGVSQVRFDHSGSYLGVVGATGEGQGRLAVQGVKDWTTCGVLAHPTPFAGLAWGGLAQSLVTSVQDSTAPALLVFGSK